MSSHSQSPAKHVEAERVSCKKSNEQKPHTVEQIGRPPRSRPPVQNGTTALMKGNTEPPVPWPKTDGEKEQEDWRAYCDRRFQECQQHAVALEYLLNKYPEQRTWLEKHGFNTEELIDSLKWYPTEELEKLDAATAKAAARNVQREQLRKSSAQNYDRMQENLLRLLPLVREVQEELESVATGQAAPALARTKIPRPGNNKLPSSSSKAHSAYSSIKPIGAQWKV